MDSKKMFEVGLFTDEVSQDFDVAVRLAKEFNIKSLEIRSVWNVPGPHELGTNDIEKIRKIIDKEGLKIISIASPFFKCDLGSKEQYKEHINILKKCINVAKKLNANIVRGFTFWKKGDLQHNWEQIIGNFKEPVKIVENEGIVLGIENEPSCYISSAKNLAKFVNEVNSNKVRVIWDPGNEIFDVDGGEEPYPTAYEHIKNMMVHVHIKDAVRKGVSGVPECTCVGEGGVDYKGQLKALKDDGYAGCISLETHWRLKGDLTDEQIKKPGGSSFSSSGEASSRLCLKNLFKIIKEGVIK